MKHTGIFSLSVIIIVMVLFSSAKSSSVGHALYHNNKQYQTAVHKTDYMSSLPSDSTKAWLRGKTVYKTYCLSCHQFDGGGVEGLNPPLITTAFVLGNKARIIQIILKGFDKRVEIDGEQYSNNMAPLNFLTDQQIADVLTYVRNDFGNKATVVRASEVQIVRSRLAK